MGKRYLRPGKIFKKTDEKKFFFFGNFTFFHKNIHEAGNKDLPAVGQTDPCPFSERYFCRGV